VGDLLVVEEDVAKAVLNEMRTGLGRSAGGEYDYSDKELKLEVLEPSGRWYTARCEDFVLKAKHRH